MALRVTRKGASAAPQAVEQFQMTAVSLRLPAACRAREPWSCGRRWRRCPQCDRARRRLDGEILREAYEGARVDKVVDVGRELLDLLAAKKRAVPSAMGQSLAHLNKPSKNAWEHGT